MQGTGSLKNWLNGSGHSGSDKTSDTEKNASVGSNFILPDGNKTQYWFHLAGADNDR